MPSEPSAFLFLRGEHVPDRWRQRAVPLAMVPLLPQEADAILSGGSGTPTLDQSEERLAGLLARGLAVSEIARETSEPLRSVQRRVARLRERFGIATTSALAAELARRGFGAGADAPTGDAGATPRHGEQEPKNEE